MKSLLKTLFTLTLLANISFGQSLWLDEMDFSKLSFNITKNPPGDNTPLVIKNIESDRGIGLHYFTMLEIDLKGTTKSFSAIIGADAKATAKDKFHINIIADDKPVFISGTCDNSREPNQININLDNCKILRIYTTTDGDPQINLANAKFEYDGASPQILIRQPYILTPTPSAKPKINSAKVFGVRPGSAFQYLIAASGNRPMTFSASNLPKGLVLDSKTGLITGTLNTAGTYSVKLAVKNSFGKHKKELKIVVGDTICLTPPMGWNSWNCWAMEIDDSKVRACADAMVTSSLVNYGWTYINIDDGWSAPSANNDYFKPEFKSQPRDANGIILANPKFPNMYALCDYVHSKGLKIGLYSSPGTLTCGNCAASYKYEEKDAMQFALWGFDYLKYDWCSYGMIEKYDTPEYFQKPYIVMRDSLKKASHDIVYSICQYGMGDVWKWGPKVNGNCWRMSGDIIDAWDQYGLKPWAGEGNISIVQLTQKMENLSAYNLPGHYNDPDMLVIGKVGWGRLRPSLLTPDEQYTHLSLWCLWSSPMLIGSPIDKLDDFTKNLLTNSEVLAVNQDPLCKQASLTVKNDKYQIWTKDLEDGSKAVGIVNLSILENKYSVNFSDIGLKGKFKIRDLWRQKDLGTFREKFETTVPGHGIVLVKMTK
jgi:alpha-galactosidase